MRILKALLAVSAAIASTAVLAQADPRIEVSLKAINKEVTLARAAGAGQPSLNTLAAYTFTVKNTSTNQLNRLYLRNAVAKTFEGADVLWDSVNGIDPNGCTGFGTTTLNCDTTLSAGPAGGSASFIVVARAPTTGSEIVVTYSGGGYEGNGNGNGCCANAGPTNNETKLVDSTNDNRVNNRVQSYLRKDKPSQLFTGDRYITRATDQITSNVDIPVFSASYGLGTILEGDSPAQCLTSTKLTKCFTSDLSIKDGTATPQPIDFSPNFLTITLRIDSSAVLRGTTINDIQIFYTDEAGGRNAVPGCANTSPIAYPCWTDRKVYRGGNRDLKDDFEWTIKHFKNGRYDLF